MSARPKGSRGKALDVYFVGTRFNLGPITDYLDLGISWFSSVPPGMCQVVSRLGLNRILPNSTIRLYTGSLAEKSLNSLRSVQELNTYEHE
jgi:hypothetical protein